MIHRLKGNTERFPINCLKNSKIISKTDPKKSLSNSKQLIKFVIQYKRQDKYI